MARASPPPAARSSSPSEAGRTAPCATATASSGVSIWASGAVTSVLVISDMVDYAFGVVRGRELGRARHLARQVVRDTPRRDRARQPPDDRVRRVAPAELLEHHGYREQHRPGIDLVEAGVLRGRAVRRFE